MVEKVITLTDEQNRRAETLARKLGYDGVDAYLRAVIEDILEEEPIDVLAEIREGFRDIREGRVYPAADLDALLDSGKFDE